MGSSSGEHSEVRSVMSNRCDERCSYKEQREKQEEESRRMKTYIRSGQRGDAMGPCLGKIEYPFSHSQSIHVGP